VQIEGTDASLAGPANVAKIIYFDFDSYVVKPEFQGAIEAHAKYLTANKTRKMAIEGHTDERGGREYNLALGQKRAEAVRRALGLLGVSDAQVEAVSFGKEKPAVPAPTKKPWRRTAALNSTTAKPGADREGVPDCRDCRGRPAGVQCTCGLFEDDEARRAILDLRQKVDAAQLRTADDVRKTTEDNAQLRRSLLDLSNQIEALRNELATMRGQNENLARNVAEMQRTQKDLTTGVDERLRKFEPGKVTVDGKEFVADPAERQEFETALATLRKGDFAAAQTSFLAFMKRYPQTGYRASALFWLGNAQYALRNYRDAVTNFRTLVTAEPDHMRAPEAMLSLANCQVELKDTKSARKTLEDLVKAYPQAEAASVAKERLAKLK
jgi:tol-pal system protein YbgF/peptidoglycan-associated lipoprotein